MLDQLEGSWRLRRDIAAEGATMTGVAHFTRVAADVLHYEETGTLTLREGQTLSCSRRYRFIARGDALVILFEDEPDRGRQFVSLGFVPADAHTLVAADTHLCGPDTYTVAYRLALPAGYETEISVQGPRKDYTALSRYTRLVDPV
nr:MULTISPECIES: DUF6314 family protein [unclassified Bordetella]